MINTDTSNQIKQTFSELAKLEAVQRHYDSLVEQEDHMISERDSIEKQLTKELKDVENLEKMGVKSMFYNILGSKSSQLEKERQEYLQLGLKHTEHLKSLKLLKYEKELIEGKLGNIGRLLAKIDNLKKTREKEIMKSDSTLRKQLMTIAGNIDRTQKRIADLRESLKKGNATIMSIKKVIVYFKKAKDWGNWDMATRRNNRYSYNKTNAINAAVNEANRTNMLLNSFIVDLNSIGYQVRQISLGYKSFSGFMDILFDNLISDWLMQSKIKSALGNTEAVKDRVGSILATINKEKENLTVYLDNQSKAKEDILLS